MKKLNSDYIFDAQKPADCPELVRGALAVHGVDAGELLLLIKTDIDEDCRSAECFLAFDKEQVYRICGVTGIDKKRKNAINGKTMRVFTELSFAQWKIADLSGVRTEELASTCRIVATNSGKSTLLANLSMSYRADAILFADTLSRFIEKGEFTVETHEGESKKDLFCPKCGLRYADPDRKICPHCQKKTKVISRSAVIFKKYTPRLVAIAVLLMIIGGLSVISPYFSSKFLYDQVLEKTGAYYGQLLFVISIVVLTRLLMQAVNAVNMAISSLTAADMIYELRRTIFNAINRLSLGFFTSRKTGGLMTQVHSDSTTVYWFFCDILPYVSSQVIQIIAVFVVMLLLSPPLCLAAMILLPVSVFVTRFIFKKVDVLFSRRFAKKRSLDGQLSDMLGGARVVKAFSGEPLEKKRFEVKNKGLAQAERETSVYIAKTFPAVRVFLELGNILVWALGGAMILTHAINPSLVSEQTVLTYGTLAAFISYVSMIYSPIFGIVDMLTEAADSVNAMGRLVEILDAKPDVVEKEHPLTPERMEGNVAFENVSFEYIKARPVIEDISFEVPAGKTLGIVGKTGAGKTTLASLLVRLYDPTGGKITIDGNDLRDLSFDFLRKNVAIVSQDTYLFSGSVLDNVRYANESASLAEVFEACVASGAHEFIMNLPDGYQTMIGQGHKDLSGGERQRLSIARAILQKPKILILDEATAAMDTRTEQTVQRSIEALSEGRTTIMIAHRLSTLKNADELIVLDDKKLVERGTPEELIKKKGVYFKLYSLQLEALKTIGISEE